MNKELLAQLISFVERSNETKEKYHLLRQLYFCDMEGTKLDLNTPMIKRVYAIQTIDEVVRRIIINDLSYSAARNFSQTQECALFLSKGI